MSAAMMGTTLFRGPCSRGSMNRFQPLSLLAQTSTHKIGLV